MTRKRDQELRGDAGATEQALTARGYTQVPTDPERGRQISIPMWPFRKKPARASARVPFQEFLRSHVPPAPKPVQDPIEVETVCPLCFEQFPDGFLPQYKAKKANSIAQLRARKAADRG